MRLLIRALGEESVLGNVVSFRDPRGSVRADRWAKELGFEFYGCAESKVRFAIESFRRSGGEDFVVFGHLMLAPVGWLLKRIGRIQDYGVILHGVEAWRELPIHQRIAIRDADLVVATTPYTAKTAAALNNLEAKQLEILPLALEPGRFEEVGEIEFRRIDDSDDLRILGVGRIAGDEQYKGFGDVVRAVGLAADRGVGVHFRHIGGGNAQELHSRLAGDLGVSDRVEFRGKVSEEVLERSFEWADVFAMPSKGEGFGLVYLEAMCHGLPAIACPEGGAQHVVDDGENGLLVEYGSPTELEQAFEELRDFELRRSLGERGIHDIRTKYSFDRFRADLDDIVRNSFELN